MSEFRYDYPKAEYPGADLFLDINTMQNLILSVVRYFKMPVLSR